MLKVISTTKLKKNWYSVEFNDGILLNIKYEKGKSSWTDVGPMCSLGVDSYFYKNGHYPKGQNLRNRLLKGTDAIKARMQRYKRKDNIEE